MVDHRSLLGALAISLFVIGCSSDDTSDEKDQSQAGGGAAGSAEPEQGGSSGSDEQSVGGRVNQGGTSEHGGRANLGGTGEGGRANTGGSGTGGTEIGGSTAGGAEPGGAESGGTETAGASTGGAESAGAANGGAESGGAANGGDESGGTESGGAAAGGADTAGASTGGADTAGASTGGAAMGGSGGENTEPAVRFVGRFDWSESAGPRFEWSGSEMQARFSGTEVSVHLNGSDNYFVSVVDGTVNKFHFTGGDQVIELASGLDPGEHEVRVSRVTEAFYWWAQFLGFDFGSGTLLPPPPDPGRHIEVIGDSISAGYGIEGPNRDCPFTPDTENHYLTYEAIAARELGADLVTLAWSGIGMYSNSGGDLAPPHMPEQYLLTMPDFVDGTWDFTQYTPEVVVIALGTNDFSSGDPGEGFQAAYTEFVSDLRGRYPDAFVYLATSPMMSGSDQDQLTEYLNAIIAERQGLNDDRIELLPFASQDEAVDGLGCGWHPSRATHQKMATLMVQTIREDLGW